MTRMIRGLKDFTYENRLHQLKLTTLEQEDKGVIGVQFFKFCMIRRKLIRLIFSN